MSGSSQHNGVAHLSAECALSVAPRRPILKRTSDGDICNYFDNVPKKEKKEGTDPRTKAEQVGNTVIEVDLNCESDYNDLQGATTRLLDYMKNRPRKKQPECRRNRERGVVNVRQHRTLLIQDVIVGI